MLPSLKRLFKDYAESGALHTLVPVESAIDDFVLATKNGALLAAVEIHGVDAECLETSKIEHITQRFQRALKTFGENYRIYQYFCKEPADHIPQPSHGNPIVQQAENNRAAYLGSKNLSRIRIVWVIVDESWKQSLSPQRGWRAFVKQPFSTASEIDRLRNTLEKACKEVNDKAQHLTIDLAEVLKPERLSKERAFQFLYRFLNYQSHKTTTAKLHYDQFVDFQLVDSHLECHRDHLRLDNEFVVVLTLKDLPSQTKANLLARLQDIPCNLVAVTEWKRTSNASIRKLVRSKQRHFHNSKVSVANYLNSAATGPKDVLVDQSAGAVVNDLGGCLEAMDLHDRYFGEFSFTIVLHDADLPKLRRAVAECVKACAACDITLIEERYNLLNAFLSTLPGNDAFNLRRVWISDANYADCSFLFAPSEGYRSGSSLGDHIAVLETNNHTPYFFNLHTGDIPHTFVLGATGSGKSFLLNFFLIHLQKFAPYTVIFDVGGSYEGLTRLVGGTYVRVDLGNLTFRINPFSLPLTPENHRFLLSFVRVLIESAGYVLTATDERDIHDQIENLYSIDPTQRRLLTLANILNRPLREQLGRWVQGGPHAALFDNVEDNVSFAAFQTFDFEGMSKVPELLQPLLFYILHRANAIVYDPALLSTFKVFAIDEAWRLLQHPVIRSYVQEALKTWRKKNAAMILATQSGDDLVQSAMLPVAVESCLTKIFLANPGMDARIYRDAFHLNETEAALIAGLSPKRQLLVHRTDNSAVLNLNVDPKGYWLYTNNPIDNQKKREAFDRYGFDQGLDFLARSHS